MSFEDNLQLALDPAGTASEQLPRELHLGQYAWKNGKIDWNDETPGFRLLRAENLRQLMSRLQAAPQHHVILLNLMGHGIGTDMMRELAEPIAALKALQVLILYGKLFLIYLGCVLQRDVQGSSHAAGNGIGDSGCIAVAGALPHLLALEVLDLVGNCF